MADSTLPSSSPDQERLVLGPSEGAKSMRMIAWAVGAIVGFGGVYVSLGILEEPVPLGALVGALVGVVCVIGAIAAARHQVAVDADGIIVRQLWTKVVPWSTVQGVRLERRTIKTPTAYNENTGETYDGDVIIAALVLTAELKNGRRMTLPIRVAEGTMSSKRVAELAQVLNQLCLAAGRG